jgi:hypothetical protein
LRACRPRCIDLPPPFFVIDDKGTRRERAALPFAVSIAPSSRVATRRTRPPAPPTAAHPREMQSHTDREKSLI